MKHLQRGIRLGALAGLVACGSGSDGPNADTQARLAISGRSNANPSMAARGDFVAVAWSASLPNATDIYLATSSDGGREFSAPVRVNDVAGDARVNGEFPPRVALIPRASGAPSMVVVWTTRRDDGTRIQWSRSDDGGASFTPAAPVPGSVAAGSRGWESVAVDSAGRVMVLWLDHRDVPASPGAHQHGASPQHPAMAEQEDPTARAAFSKLYFAALDDSAAKSITGSVCYCCKTSLTVSGSSVFASWRHVYAGSARDIALAVSRDGGKSFSAPVRVSDDGWKIDGCPENGPAVAVDGRNRVHVVWATPPDGKSDTPLDVFHASSTDGQQFAPRTKLPTAGAASHAQIATLADGSLLVAWDEIIGADRRVGLARASVDGSEATRFSRLWSGAAVPGRAPVIAATTSGAVVGWIAGADTGSAIILARVP